MGHHVSKFVEHAVKEMSGAGKDRHRPTMMGRKP
jgi:hypothetical protein